MNQYMATPTAEELLRFRLLHEGRAFRDLYRRLEVLAAEDPNGPVWVALVEHDVWRERNGMDAQFSYPKTSELSS